MQDKKNPLSHFSLSQGRLWVPHLRQELPERRQDVVQDAQDHQGQQGDHIYILVSTSTIIFLTNSPYHSYHPNIYGLFYQYVSVKVVPFEEKYQNIMVSVNEAMEHGNVSKYCNSFIWK